jgi:hypothetical protein
MLKPVDLASVPTLSRAFNELIVLACPHADRYDGVEQFFGRAGECVSNGGDERFTTLVPLDKTVIGQLF